MRAIHKADRTHVDRDGFASDVVVFLSFPLREEQDCSAPSGSNGNDRLRMQQPYARVRAWAPRHAESRIVVDDAIAVAIVPRLREIEKGIRSAPGMSRLFTRLSSRLIVGKNAGRSPLTDGYKEEAF